MVSPAIDAFRLLTLTLLILVVGACDPASPYAFRNGLSTSITLKVFYEGGLGGEGAPIGPGVRVGFLHPPGEIESIMVLSNGRKLYKLDKKALLELEISVPDLRDLTWNIQSDGIKPLTRSEMHRLELGE